jgi:cytoskeletal protein CcmA (bactofilin family)
MWNKRRDEEPPRPSHQGIAPFAAQPTPHPVEAKKEATSMSSTPVRTFEPENRSGNAAIGKSIKVVGQIYAKEDLYVDGALEGTVEIPEHKLTIGPHGTVQASIKAREVMALGTIQGNVEATDRIEIRKDAKLMGDIRTARIVIEDGAYFKGSIDIIRPEPARVSPKPPAPAAGPANIPIVTANPEAKR